MMRWAAVVWTVLVIVAGGYLAARVQHGLPLRTDLLALLPREDRDPVLLRANETVTRNLSRRIVVLVGHADRTAARAAAGAMKAGLAVSGALAPQADMMSAERFKEIGKLYFPYRRGLLADTDRDALREGHGIELTDRAVAQAFGAGGVASAQLLQSDPFLLLPAFLTGLPVPLSKLAPDDGMLSVADGGKTWVALFDVLAGEPFALEVQEKLAGAYDRTAAQLKSRYPGVEMKRLGAVFFAHQGSQRGLTEASLLSAISTIGTIVLVLVLFRRLMPLLGNMLVVVVGIGMGLAASLALFGDLHVASLLFGTSLIGMAVDYGLFYTASVFDPAGGTAAERLRITLPGMALGLATSVLGYGALLLAPFPGLRQIAVFSVIGLIAAFLTVVLWLPYLDRAAPLRQDHKALALADRVTRFWDGDRWRQTRMIVLGLAMAVAVFGLMRFRADDDVRRLQALAPELLAEQVAIQNVIGATAATQFLLIEGADDETALVRGEALLPVLARLATDGALSSAQSPAAFVPSAARQRENATLRGDALDGPHLVWLLDALGMPPTSDVWAQTSRSVLTLPEALASGAVPFLNELVLGPGLHVVALQGLKNAPAVRAAVAGLPGVRFVDPTADFSALLGRYRVRAMVLTLLSVLAMYGVMIWRYGIRGAGWVILPAAAAAVLVPAILALLGQPYTFFSAMAQVILLAVGTDYALFCAEAQPERNAATLFSVWLAAMTTLLSFGLLVFSAAPAVRDFGGTMLIGILVSVDLAPLANRAQRRQ